jgi:hypothetical protein
MTKLSKRLEKLENILSPPKRKKGVMIIQHVGETEKQAISRAGIADLEAIKIWIVRIVAPKTRQQLVNEENKQ